MFTKLVILLQDFYRSTMPGYSYSQIKALIFPARTWILDDYGKYHMELE